MQKANADEKSSGGSGGGGGGSGGGGTLLSSKILALFSEFELASKADPTWKAVVFSQWTSMLDLVQEAFKERKISYVRLDGSMNTQVGVCAAPQPT